jgi:hypothetical protein
VKTVRCCWPALGALLLLGGGGVASAPTLPELNQRIVDFARAQLGKQVGDGECTALVVAAYRSAGARRLPPYGRDADYVWGAELRTAAEVLPGDVIQFRDARFERRERLRNGGQRVTTTTFPHHTAIVAETRPSGAAFVILHQNSGDPSLPEAQRRTVRQDSLRMQDHRRGKLWFYRPLPDGE